MFLAILIIPIAQMIAEVILLPFGEPEGITAGIVYILWGILYPGFAAGVVEEMVFRGLILDLLKERWNLAVAVIAPSVVFGFVHVLGTNFSIGSIILVTVAGTMVGIMFSLVALEGGSIWNSAVMHMAWNAIIIGGLFRVGINKDPAAIASMMLRRKKKAN